MPRQHQASLPELAPVGRLPVPLTSFIGREQEVADVRALLTSARLVTLTGPGGTGKTRLALAVANQAVDAFPDGVFFVSLASFTDSALVPSAIATALGLQAHGRQVDADFLARALCDRQLLLVIDNFEHVIDAAPLITDLLMAAAQIKALVTSRTILRLGAEQRYLVPPLGVPDEWADLTIETFATFPAIQLFVERACAARSDFMPGGADLLAVAAICRRLDGLPLALELAAARVHLLSPRALLDHLSTPLRLLTGGPVDLPERQRALRATVEWSYRLLGTRDRRMFECLAVFSGGFSFDANGSVCNVRDNGELLDGVTALVDSNLLRREEGATGEPRFQMLETIREYALERLEASEKAAVVRRAHAGYYRSLAEEIAPRLCGGGRGALLERLDAELGNLRAAIAWSERDADSLEDGLRLAVALEWYWHFRDHWREAHDWLQRLLARTGTALHPEVRASALYAAGRFSLFLSDFAVAEAYLRESVGFFRETGDYRRLGFALIYSARLEARLGNHAACEADAAEAGRLFGECGDRWGAALALYYRGDSAVRTGDYSAAVALASSSKALFRELRDDWGVTLASETLVLAAMSVEDIASAGGVAEEALTSARRIGERLMIASFLQSQADIELAQGNIGRAIELCQERLAMQSQLGETLGTVQSLLSCARIAAALRDSRRETALRIEALRRAQRIGHAPAIAICISTLLPLLPGWKRSELSLRLGAVAERCSRSGGLPLWTAERRAHRTTMAALAVRINTEAAAKTWASGEALPLEVAIDAAIAALAAIADGLTWDEAVISFTQELSAVPTGNQRIASPDGLTPREVEVLGLLAAGRSNREIADELVLSVRTAERHIANLYEKIGARGRVARAVATDYAHRHGLIQAGVALAH